MTQLFARQAVGQFPATRRCILGGAAALSACANLPKPSPDADLEGIETPSESVQLSMASADGKVRFLARLCRFPAFQRAWIWVLAMTPTAVVTFVDHQALDPAPANPVDDRAARYQDGRPFLQFDRDGPAAAPHAAMLTGEAPAWRSARGRFGAGSERLVFTAKFAPLRARAGLLPGRSEAFGEVELELKTPHGEFIAAGLGQFHEQRQTDPRFVTPFAYASLWARTASGTLLLTPQGEGGFIVTDAGRRDFTRIDLERPTSQIRALNLRAADGALMSGSIDVVQRFTLPVFGRDWRGAFVDATLDGADFRGLLNDWRAAEVPYRL